MSSIGATVAAMALVSGSHNGLDGVVATSPVGGGSVRNDLSTGLVTLYREMFGRGPVKTTTHAFDAGYVTFLRDVLAPHERLLVRNGRADLVGETRTAVRDAEREHVIAEV